MGNVPFTITDALGYVAAGLILMVAATIAVLGELPTEVSIVTGIGIGVGAYVVGHLHLRRVHLDARPRSVQRPVGAGPSGERVDRGAERRQGAAPVANPVANYYTCLPAAIEKRVKTAMFAMWRWEIFRLYAESD